MQIQKKQNSGETETRAQLLQCSMLGGARKEYTLIIIPITWKINVKQSILRLRTKAQPQGGEHKHQGPRAGKHQASTQGVLNLLYVTTYVLFNRYTVFIQMFIITDPSILMSIHYNDFFLWSLVFQMSWE